MYNTGQPEQYSSGDKFPAQEIELISGYKFQTPQALWTRLWRELGPPKISAN
jgi:hypothetical protein